MFSPFEIELEPRQTDAGPKNLTQRVLVVRKPWGRRIGKATECNIESGKMLRRKRSFEIA